MLGTGILPKSPEHIPHSELGLLGLFVMLLVHF